MLLRHCADGCLSGRNPAACVSPRFPVEERDWSRGAQNVTLLPDGELHVNGKRLYWHDEVAYRPHHYGDGELVFSWFVFSPAFVPRFHQVSESEYDIISVECHRVCEVLLYS